jgi:hypothetical protein
VSSSRESEVKAVVGEGEQHLLEEVLGKRQESSNRSHGYLITKEKHHFDESRLSVKLLFYFHRTDPTRQTVFHSRTMNKEHT